ncbi:MAG: transposase [Bacteroidota bacterium]
MHPHLHCIVPGGGVMPSGKWKSTKSKGKYLFPKNALQKVFKGKFRTALKELAAKDIIELPHNLKEKLYRKKWVVYAKRPFAKPENVIEYLGRYMHKTAISNYRLKQLSDRTVKFSYKDYETGGTIKGY